MPLAGQRSHIKDHARHIYKKAETGGLQLLIIVVGWRSCLTQWRTVTEVKHGRAR